MSVIRGSSSLRARFLATDRHTSQSSSLSCLHFISTITSQNDGSRDRLDTAPARSSNHSAGPRHRRTLPSLLIAYLRVCLETEGAGSSLGSRPLSASPASASRRPAHHAPTPARAVLVEDFLGGQQRPQTFHALPESHGSSFSLACALYVQGTLRRGVSRGHEGTPPNRSGNRAGVSPYGTVGLAAMVASGLSLLRADGIGVGRRRS